MICYLNRDPPFQGVEEEEVEEVEKVEGRGKSEIGGSIFFLFRFLNFLEKN